MLVDEVGGSYARQLGIDLSGGASREIYKWFIAAVLFGARISEKIAMKTYREFEQARMLVPKRMAAAKWDALVGILDRGGYARYDFKTATKLLNVNRTLMREYGGNLNKLHESVRDAADLEQHLKDLGAGIGEVTVNIFLRELRGIWEKADPPPSERAIRAAKALHFIPARLKNPARALQTLNAAWLEDGMAPESFPEFEAALVRDEAILRRKRKRENTQNRL